jgi:hypothetical protein
LISLDADVNLVDSLGKTPLDLARMLLSAPGEGVKLSKLENGTAAVENDDSMCEWVHVIIVKLEERAVF